jgi:undecaprenyl-diphosphatase
MALGIAVAVVAWKTRWRWPVLGLCGVTVVVYGAALVYTRDHYPSDIVCGWCIAVGWTGAVALAARLGRRLPRLPRWRGRAPTRSAR